MKYDSKAETLEHISMVRMFILDMITVMINRSKNHDKSKLEEPEKVIFDEQTPKLKGSTYGSDEYKTFLEGMKEGLDHHYSKNRHHPEHFDNGIQDMNLIDIMEMLCDWKAATLRHADGDIMKSLEINKERFNIPTELFGILKNTVFDMEWE